MRSASPNFRSPFLIPLALLAACQDSPVAPPVAARTPSADVTLASTFVVTNTTDAEEGSLRAAIAAAEANAGPDVISFAIGAGDPGCAGGTCMITLATQLAIASPDGVTIDGTGAGATIVVSGNQSTRVLEVAAGAQATLRMLTIANGSHPFGGGIRNAGTLRLEQLVVRDNVSVGTPGRGGGISNSGALELIESTVTGNHAVRGGGVYSE